MTSTTKQHLLELGVQLLLKHGYADLGVATLLEQAGVPKGSFYHHFKSKEDFGLQVIDLYMANVHVALDEAFGDTSGDPLKQVRQFFEMVTQSYKGEGYLGCLLGGLGQELSAVSPTFRKKVETCFARIARQIAKALKRVGYHPQAHVAAAGTRCEHRPFAVQLHLHQSGSLPLVAAKRKIPSLPA